ncbi:hypothetical protein BGX24_011099 [Mortierella sp. AD032]|nr:hypothetical protein BGX24_011099 [Mortierella sp. AD032]
MKAGVSIMLAIAVCASSSSMMVNAQKPTVGHTATLFDKTVFIQGGYGPDGVATNAAYSLILSANGAYAGSSMLDITALSAFSARGYHNSVDSVGGLMINCGGFGGDSIVNGKMSCDIFNPIKYNSTRMNMSKPNVKPRGGMAVAIGGETSVSAYFMGGSATLSSSVAAENLFSTDVNVLTLSSTLNWRVGTPMLVATRYHTATWIDSVKGIVVLGGQLQGGTAVAMNTAAIFSANIWTNRPIVGDVPPPRFGHSAVCDDSGKIYIYGGQAGSAGIIFNDIFVLDTAAATWAWKKINVPTAEPRAFHSSVLLVDGTILHTFGQSGPAQNTAVDTFSLFTIASGAWTAAAVPPKPTVATETPIKGPDTSNNPNDPNFKHTTGDNGEGGGGEGGKGGAIGGAIGGIAAVGLLVAGFIFYRKRQARRHSSAGVAVGPYSKHSASASGTIGGAGRSSLHLEEGGDKSKLGRSFTIRQPAAAYIDDNSVHDLKHMRPYDDNNDYNNYNDRSAGGYGNEPAVIEYELTDTSGHRYEPGSVAERKRYVEEQQRQLMNGFESVYPDQPLPFQHQQRSNNSQQDQDYYSPTLTAVSSPNQAKLGGRSPSQSRRNRSQDQGSVNGGYTSQSPSARAQQTRQDQYQDHPDQFYNNKF